MRTRRGFTLVEMLVVIAIIGILAALLAVWIAQIGNHSRYKVTKARIHALDAGCADYRTEQGVYPPLTYAGSQSLHFHLGGPRTVNLPGGATTVRAPFLEFPRNWLAPGVTTNLPTPPSFVYDAWDRVIDYSNPSSPMIVSQGRLTADPTDDVSNVQQDW